MFKKFNLIVMLLGLMLCNMALGQNINLTASIETVPSSNLDTLFVDVKVSRVSGSVNASLGDADFVFFLKGATRRSGQFPLDTNNIRLVRRGRWDAASDTAFQPLVFTRTLDNRYLMIRVRKKLTGSAARNASFVPAAPNAAALVARLAIPMRPGACIDSADFDFVRPPLKPIGKITPFQFAQNFVTTYEDHPLTPLRPLLRIPSVGVIGVPQNVIFTWNDVRDARNYFGIVTFNNGRDRRFVSLGQNTELRWRTTSGDTVCFELITKSACAGDSVVAPRVCGVALDCPPLNFTRANVKPSTTNDSNVFCPGDLVNVRIDTFSFNPRLTQPAEFSFNNGASFSRIPNISFSATRDTTLVIRLRDANGCEPSGSVNVDIRVRRLTDPSSSVTVTAQENVCAGQRIQLNYTQVGDALNYTWSSNGSGRFVDANGNTVNPPRGAALFYIPAPTDVSPIGFTVRETCFGITGSDNTIINPNPDAQITSDGPFVGPNLVAGGLPVSFTRPNAQAGETYTWNFNDGTAPQNSTAPSITHTFANTGSFRVLLTVTTPQGCTDTASVRVNVQAKNTLYMPNAFAPGVANTGSTGKSNATYTIDGSGVTEQIEFRIYDKWGKEVFNTNSFSFARTQGWNGTGSGGSELPVGTYTYVIKVTYIDGNKEERSGNIALLR